MDPPKRLQASVVEDMNDGQPPDICIQSLYETAIMEAPTGKTENPTSEPTVPANIEERDHPAEVDTGKDVPGSEPTDLTYGTIEEEVNHSAEVGADSDLSEGDSYTACLEEHLAEVEDELKTLKSGHVAFLENRLKQVENELKELKSRE
jgi:hypothetical protein